MMSPFFLLTLPVTAQQANPISHELITKRQDIVPDITGFGINNKIA